MLHSGQYSRHHSLPRSSPPVRSPKMGRRALQRSPKPSPSIPGTPTPSEVLSGSQSECGMPQSEDLANRGLHTAPQSPGGKGLDRVLLERNLERLLCERNTTQTTSPDLERLLHARDRSREPLHLADLALSLDDWQTSPAPTERDDSLNDSYKDTYKDSYKDSYTDSYKDSFKDPFKKDNINESYVNQSATVTSSVATSLPPEVENLNSGNTTPCERVSTPESPQRKCKGSLSVRFQGDNEAFEADEADTCTSETRRFPRSRSYSGRSRHGDSMERRRPKKTTSESQMVPGSSRQTEDDTISYCSTCSSSSSSDDLAYQLPPRRAYGGVRISYVPNDALACARRKQASGPRSPVKKQLDDKEKNCIIS